MTESKIDSFNIEPLVFEIENVIKNGLRVVLKDYMNRYELLEKTHKQIMKLPSVMNEINKGYDSDSDSEPEEQDKTMFVSIKDMTQELVKKEISYVESKLDRIEKKYESISPLITKILDKLESINDEVKVLKENSRDNKIVQMEHEKPYISNIIKPSIVSACENENIKFEINEDEYEESDEEEDDVNPALITCSNISIKQEIKSEKKEESEEEDDEVEIIEPVEVKKEVIVIEEEEEEIDDELSVGQELGEHEPIENVPEIEEEEEVDDELSVGQELGEHEPVENTSEEVEETEEVEEDEVETEASDEEEEVDADEEEVEPTPADTKEEEEEDEELEIITIDDIDYCTNDMENGFIWELSEDGEQGDKVGYLKEGEPFFYADEK